MIALLIPCPGSCQPHWEPITVYPAFDWQLVLLIGMAVITLALCALMAGAVIYASQQRRNDV